MPQVKPLLQRSTISQKNSFISDIDFDAGHVRIEEDLFLTKSIKTKNLYITEIEENLGTVKINEVLPFRIKFINVGIPGYNVPPIGIAIIGYNNYIL